MQNKKIVLMATAAAVVVLAAIGIAQHETKPPAPNRPNADRFTAQSTRALDRARTDARERLVKLERMSPEEYAGEQRGRIAQRERWQRMTPQQKAEFVLQNELKREARQNGENTPQAVAAQAPAVAAPVNAAPQANIQVAPQRQATRP